MRTHLISHFCSIFFLNQLFACCKYQSVLCSVHTLFSLPKSNYSPQRVVITFCRCECKIIISRNLIHFHIGIYFIIKLTYRTNIASIVFIPALHWACKTKTCTYTITQMKIFSNANHALKNRCLNVYSNFQPFTFYLTSFELDITFIKVYTNFYHYLIFLICPLQGNEWLILLIWRPNSILKLI